MERVAELETPLESAGGDERVVDPAGRGNASSVMIAETSAGVADDGAPRALEVAVAGSSASGQPSEDAASAVAPGHPVLPAKGAYPSPSGTPTQVGPEGIRFDFNDGCRLFLPARERGSWRARLRDLDTGSILFESENKGGTIRSSKRWFVRFSIDVWAIEDGVAEPRLVLSHQYDALGQDVLIQFPVGTLGDSIAWFSYAHRFGDRHPGCRVTCVLSPRIIALFAGAYPDITFVAPDDVARGPLADRAYATYNLGLFFNDVACDFQPTDFRHVGLHKTAAYILGVDLAEKAPHLSLPDESRPMEAPYAVIAVQSSSGAKYWNNPHGWHDVVVFLKASGYQVICLDDKTVHGSGLMWTHIPHGVEDKTGLPLVECARWLKHASLFVGLSSGLAWLAWAAECPVVMISGFSHPTTEFETPFRVINWHTCNSCWNDPKFNFDHNDFLWCPRHANTPRQFECTRQITPAHVLKAIRAVPGFHPGAKPN